MIRTLPGNASNLDKHLRGSNAMGLTGYGIKDTNT